jgi:hypothetical protein
MYTNFLKANSKSFSDTSYLSQHKGKALITLDDFNSVKKLLDLFEGCTFDKGLFRVHTIGSSYFWTLITAEYFPHRKGQFCCFGFDWLGRQYAVNQSNSIVFMFDPATGEDFVLEQSLEGFFNEDLVEYRESTLVVENFNQLEKIYGKGLKPEDCIGFKIPLFLGGEDDLKNYEKTDMEVYWELNYQLFCKTRSLPEGQLINKITFE